MTKMSSSGFELTRINSMEWAIEQVSARRGNQRRAIARVWCVDDGEFEVDWVRGLSLKRFYGSLESVMEDVIAHAPHASKPAPIPHRPPISAR